MSDCPAFVSDCHVRSATELLTHGWDPVVLSALRLGPVRRRDLLERIGGLSDKVLHESLVRLTRRGLVERLGGPQATYRLTPLGESFTSGPLLALAEWARDHAAQLST